MRWNCLRSDSVPLQLSNRRTSKLQHKISNSNRLHSRSIPKCILSGPKCALNVPSGRMIHSLSEQKSAKCWLKCVLAECQSSTPLWPRRDNHAKAVATPEVNQRVNPAVKGHKHSAHRRPNNFAVRATKFMYRNSHEGKTTITSGIKQKTRWFAKGFYFIHRNISIPGFRDLSQPSVNQVTKIPGPKDWNIRVDEIKTFRKSSSLLIYEFNLGLQVE